MEFKSDIEVSLVQSVGDDWTIAKAAWVSTGAAEGKMSADMEGLIRYLMKHKHGTPFEHASMTFLVNAPIFVWREWHRHRIGFSYNEESARYKQLDPVFYMPRLNRPMMKVDGWKPGRPKFTLAAEGVHTKLCMNLQTSYVMAYEQYESNLRLGIDPGLARDCLPVGIFSACWVTCNPRSLMAFLNLRTSDGGTSYPLYEIEVAAKKCEMIFADRFPVTHTAFVENNRIAP